MNSLVIKSPAKVNLFLKITGKRPDGYHALFTLFHRISLIDTLTLRKIPSGINIKSNIKNLPTDSRNIIWKAFDAIQKVHPLKGGVSIAIKKQIPIGGGMGGGSSNAASFILGLKRLYNLKIPKKKLYEIGSKLGADVNFFLADVNQAFGRGAGDRIQPARCRQKLWFVIVMMPRPLLTAKVYQTFNLKRRKRGNGYFKNDLQEACLKLYPAVSKVIRILDQSGTVKTLVSGSGPTVFGLAKSCAVAKKIVSTFRRKSRLHKQIFIAHTV